jgi:hypothetical protein
MKDKHIDIEELQSLKNQIKMLKASEKEHARRFDKIHKAFNELLDEHLDLKRHQGHERFERENEYYWIEKAGLTDLT